MMMSLAHLLHAHTATQHPRPIVPRHIHLSAALGWIGRAYAAAGDGGISKGYDLLRARWAPSYPETTGYTIPTLLNAAAYLGQPGWRIDALRMADYLLEQRTPEGGVVHWERRGDPPVVFDTGQAIFGWLAAFRVSGEPRYLEAARRAADWLVSIQDESGAWMRNQHLGTPKTIDTRVAWALLELFDQTGAEDYTQSARRNLDWAVQQQTPDGWFQHCAFTPQEPPFTHTLAYTIEGLLLCGLRLQEKRYVEAARRGAEALLRLQRPDGSLAGTYDSGWRPNESFSCLTGNCQMGIVWLRFYHLQPAPRYLEAARKAIGFVAHTQIARGAASEIRGGIAGSAPIWGGYERFKYPNWAAKFFVDALLWLETSQGNAPVPVYAG